MKKQVLALTVFIAACMQASEQDPYVQQLPGMIKDPEALVVECTALGFSYFDIQNKDIKEIEINEAEHKVSINPKSDKNLCYGAAVRLIDRDPMKAVFDGNLSEVWQPATLSIDQGHLVRIKKEDTDTNQLIYPWGIITKLPGEGFLYTITDFNGTDYLRPLDEIFFTDPVYKIITPTFLNFIAQTGIPEVQEPTIPEAPPLTAQQEAAIVAAGEAAKAPATTVPAAPPLTAQQEAAIAAAGKQAQKTAAVTAPATPAAPAKVAKPTPAPKPAAKKAPAKKPASPVKKPAKKGK